VYARGVCDGNANLHHENLRVEITAADQDVEVGQIRLQPALLRVDSLRCRLLGAACCFASAER